MSVGESGKSYEETSLIAQLVKISSRNAGDPCLVPGQGRSAGEGIGFPLQYSWASLVAQQVKNTPVMQETWCDPWVGRSPRKGKGYPLQYSGLENSMGCIVHGVTKSRTQLNNFHFFRKRIWVLNKPFGVQESASVSLENEFTSKPKATEN